MGSSVFVGIQIILVAYDAAPHAERAADVALAMAEGMKARVVLLGVVQPPEPAEDAEFRAFLEETSEHYEEGFRPIRERAKEKSVEIETLIVVGHPAEQILHHADTIQASLIIIGKRSHTILHRWMLGSTSERVLKHAHCPVMIVH